MQEPSTLRSSRRIAGLDGLRALAATLVFLEHKSEFGRQLHLGIGVYLFFVLSGYLITGILIERRALIEAGLSSVRKEIALFFSRRCFRIFPPYYAMLVALALAYVAFSILTLSPKWLPIYATFTTNVFIEFYSKGFPRLGHLWTLAVEEQFYLLAAPLFLCCTVRNAKFIATGFIAVAVLAFLFLFQSGAEDICINVDSLLNFGMLGIGSVIAVTVRVANGKDHSAIIFGILGMVLLANLPIVLSYPERSLASHLCFKLSAVFAAIAVVGILTNQSSIAVSVLQWNPIRILGQVSYAFYLWHMPVNLQPAIHALMPASDLEPAIVLASNYLATTLIALTSWTLIESPCLRLRDRLICAPLGDSLKPDFAPVAAGFGRR